MQLEAGKRCVKTSRRNAEIVWLQMVSPHVRRGVSSSAYLEWFAALSCQGELHAMIG